MGPVAVSLGIKLPGREADTTHLYLVLRLKYVRLYLKFLIRSMSLYLIKHIDNFTITPNKLDGAVRLPSYI
jgi:hypothetical protein